ncbi:MAG TPA: flippase [Herpetosiphonaceae bacterium]
MSSSVFEASDSAARGNGLNGPIVEQHVLLAAKGGAITFVGKLFTFGCRLVITFVLARALGAGQYGLYNLALTALSVVAAVSAFGMDSTLVRYIPIFARRRDEARLWGVLQIGLGLSTLLSLALSAALFALAQPIAVEIFHQPRLAPLLRIASLIVPVLTLSNMAASATRGFKTMRYATIAQDFFQPLIRLVLVIVLVVVGLNPARALATMGIGVAVGCVMLLYFLNNLFPLRRSPRTARHEPREIFGFSVPVFLSDLMMTFRDNIQTLMLGALNSVANVGIFAVANQMNMFGSMFQSAIATASRPIISELYDQGEREQMGRMYQTTTKWSLTVNLPVFLILVLFPTQILSLFGKSFVTGATTLTLIACAIMVDVSTGMCGLILDMTGHTTLKLINNIVRLALSVALSFLLIPAWGIVGAGLSVLIVVGVTNLLRLIQVFWLFRLLPYDRSFIKPLTAGGAALGAALIVGYWSPGSADLLYAAFQSALLLAIYIGLILGLGLTSEDRVVLAHLRRRLSRKARPR